MRTLLLCIAVALVPGTVLGQSNRVLPSPDVPMETTCDPFTRGWERSCGMPSGVLDWSRSWSADWTLGTSTPTPDIECESAGSSGDLTCNVAVTKSGNPTTVGAPGYPARTAVRLDGTGDKYTLTSASAPSFTLLFGIKPDSLAGAYGVASFDGSTRGWFIYHTASIYLRLFSDNATSTLYGFGSVTAGALSVCAVSYDGSGGSGAGVFRGNCNGTAAATVTNGSAPLQATNGSHVLGAATTAGVGNFAGDAIAYARLPRASTDAELAALVASQTARLAAKPLGALVTVTSGATTCDSRGDGSLYSLPAGSLCCKAAGCEIWGAAQHSNLLPRSKTFDNATNWAASAGTLTGTTVAPDGTTTATVWSPGTANATLYTTTPGVGAAVPDGSAATQSVWAKTDAGTCDFNIGMTNAATWTGATVYGFTATTAWQRFWMTGTHQTGGTPQVAGVVFGGYTAGSGQTLVNQKSYSGCTLHLVDPQTVLGSIVGPYSETDGAAYVGAADVPSVATTLTNPAKWCVGVRAKPTGVWATAVSGLLSGGTATSANSWLLHLYLDGKVYFDVYDASAAQRRVSASHGAAPGSEHTVVACSVGGAQRLYFDGADMSAPSSGAGTGILGSIPASMIIGSYGSATQVNGLVKTVCQGPDYASVRKCLGAP